MSWAAFSLPAISPPLKTKLNHQPIVEGDETCVCLFATERRLKPQGLLGRIAFAYANV
jgi:anti-sigma factor ChrR (cupin superfamily)